MSSSLFFKRLALLAGSIVMLLYVLAPVAWLLSSSLQREADITSIPPHWIPHPPTLSSFKAIVAASTGTAPDDGNAAFIPSTAQYLLPALRNSLVVATAVVLLNLLVSVPAAYAMAKIRYIGRDLSVYFMLATRVIPDIALVVPFFLFVRKLGLLDSVGSLIITYLAITVPFSVFMLLKGQFKKSPEGLFTFPRNG